MNPKAKVTAELNKKLQLKKLARREECLTKTERNTMSKSI